MLSIVAFALLAAPALAAPQTSRAYTGCDISKATFTPPAGDTTVVPPTNEGPSFIGLAFGVQNYTCAASTSTWTNVGAVAELVDASCLYGTPAFDNATQTLYNIWENAPPNVTTQAMISHLKSAKLSCGEILGQHYYVPTPNATSGVSPKWDFTSASYAGNPEAFVVASKTAAINAPTNATTDITWVFLTAIPGQGELASNVYRVATRGGQPPASCTPGAAEISVKYTAQYWLYGGSIKA